MNITDLAAQRALDRLAKGGFDALTETDKTLAAVWLIEATVMNDGFVRYFRSQRGNLAFYAPVALRRIGAVKLAAIAEEANTVFGPDGPPPDATARRAIVRTIDPATLRRLEELEERYFTLSEVEDVDALMEVFLRESNGDSKTRNRTPEKK